MPLPHSLRWQFRLALSLPTLLIMSDALAAIYGWHSSSSERKREQACGNGG
jgi:hypothetical protein